MSTFKVLNDPEHVCALPDAAMFAYGTDVECEEMTLNGYGQVRECGKRYTRTQTFWSKRPYWADYDYGW